MYARSRVFPSSFRSRGVGVRQEQHTLSISDEGYDNAGESVSYHFIVVGGAATSPNTSGDFDTPVGPAEFCSGFVRGGTDVWEIDGHVVHFRIQQNRGYDILVDGQPARESDVVSMTGGGGIDIDAVFEDYYAPDPPPDDGTNGENGNGENGTNGENGNGENGNGKNGNGGDEIVAGLTGWQVAAIAVVAALGVAVATRRND